MHAFGVDASASHSASDRARATQHPWVFCVFDRDSDVKVVQDRRLAYNPYIVFRWSTVEGESLGRGPILEAMADIQSLNRLWETYFAWVQRNSLGMTLVRNSELAYADLGRWENFEFQIGKLLPVNDPANFVPLKISGDLSATQFLMEEFVAAHRPRGFFPLGLSPAGVDVAPPDPRLANPIGIQGSKRELRSQKNQPSGKGAGEALRSKRGAEPQYTLTG
jgi:hypothetical protein